MIYFLQQGADGPIKIGYTTGSISIRKNQIQTSCPEKLTLLGTMEGDENQERLLHAFFHAHKLHGEWFEPAPMVLNYIFSLIVQMDTTKTLEMQGENANLKAKIETLMAEVSINLDPKILEGNRIDLDNLIQSFEKKMLKYALDRFNHKKTDAAKYLSISFRSIRHRLQKYHL